MTHLRAAWAQRIGATGGIVWRGMVGDFDADASEQFYMAMTGGNLVKAAQVALEVAESFTPPGQRAQPGHLGLHWSTDKNAALVFTNISSERTVTLRCGIYNYVPMLIEASYDQADVETDPERLRDLAVQGYGWENSSRVEAEVTLRPGAAIQIKAIHLCVPRDLEYAKAVFEECYEGVMLPFDWKRVPMGVRKVAGPASGVIPDRVKDRKPVNTHAPKPVVIDPMAKRDIERLYPDEVPKVYAAIELLEQGKAPIEPKHRDELVGTFGIRIDRDCRLLVFPHIDGAWHVFYVGHHDYEEAERRMSAPRERVASRASVTRVVDILARHFGVPAPRVEVRSGGGEYDGTYEPDTGVLTIYEGEGEAETVDTIVHEFAHYVAILRGLWEEGTSLNETENYYADHDENFDRFYEEGLRAIGGRTASLQSGLFWRAHPKGRPLSVEDATSTLLNPPYETRRGYSCYRDPWDLWVYMFVQRAMFSPQDREVIGFDGQRVGGGNDGEDLAVPIRPVVRMSWGSFEHELLTTPFPDRPLKLVRAVLWGGLQPTWPSFARVIRYQDDYHGDKVLERILETWDT